MWNFIKSLLSNRFGIVMATLNVCYLIHIYQSFDPVLTNNIFHQMVLCINSPGLMTSGIILFLFKPFLHPNLTLDLYYFKYAIWFFPFFVAFQWLFIGWLAKTIAQKINLAKTN